MYYLALAMLSACWATLVGIIFSKAKNTVYLFGSVS